jgi:pyrroline-5-carboxylate reductase
VVLAIKPQMLDQAAATFSPWVGQHTLVVSVLAGKTVANVSELLGAVAALKPGVAAPLSVQRAGKTSDISVTPAKRQRPKTPN